METTTDSITATRFDVEYAQVYIISPMGDGGECLHREGQFYHFQNGSVWPGFGFPRPDAYTLTKTGTITARPCFYWKHDMVCMEGTIDGNKVRIVPDVADFHNMRADVSIDGEVKFSTAAKMYPDMAICPVQPMAEIELMIIIHLQ